MSSIDFAISIDGDAVQSLDAVIGDWTRTLNLALPHVADPFVPEPESPRDGWVEHVADPFDPDAGEMPVGMVEWDGTGEPLRPVLDGETMGARVMREVEDHFLGHWTLDTRDAPGVSVRGALLDTMLDRMTDAGEVRRLTAGLYERLTEPEPEPHEPRPGFDFLPINSRVMRSPRLGDSLTMRFAQPSPPLTGGYDTPPLPATCTHDMATVQGMIEDGRMIYWSFVICEHTDQAMASPWRYKGL